MTRINMFHVPYRGSAPALSDLISGEVQVMFDLMASSIGYIRAGQLRALAVTAAQRSEASPELPTVADFVPLRDRRRRRRGAAASPGVSTVSYDAGILPRSDPRRLR